MSTSFPIALDSFRRPSAAETLGAAGHAARHDDALDGVEALERKVGVDNSADTTTLDYRMRKLEAVFGPGVMFPYAGPGSPSGTVLYADGRAVARAGIYGSLFNAIGTTWGAGNGTTTFNIPDARGRMPLNTDDGTGRVGLANVLLGQAGGDWRMQAHSHTAAMYTGVAGIFGGILANLSATNQFQNGWIGTTGSGGQENMPPYFVVRWFIIY